MRCFLDPGSRPPLADLAGMTNHEIVSWGRRVYIVCRNSRLGHLDLDHLNVPFDSAQGGELVEPFRVSCLRFRIFISGNLEQIQ